MAAIATSLLESPTSLPRRMTVSVCRALDVLFGSPDEQSDALDHLRRIAALGCRGLELPETFLSDAVADVLAEYGGRNRDEVLALESEKHTLQNIGNRVRSRALNYIKQQRTLAAIAERERTVSTADLEPADTLDKRATVGEVMSCGDEPRLSFEENIRELIAILLTRREQLIAEVGEDVFLVTLKILNSPELKAAAEFGERARDAAVTACIARALGVSEVAARRRKKNIYRTLVQACQSGSHWQRIFSGLNERTLSERTISVVHHLNRGRKPIRTAIHISTKSAVKQQRTPQA